MVLIHLPALSFTAHADAGQTLRPYTFSPSSVHNQRKSHRALSSLRANPNTPRMEATWRGRTRAKLGYPLKLGAFDEHFSLSLPVLIELHNRDSKQVFPHEYWRARAAIALHYRMPRSVLPPSLSLYLQGMVEHESAHETSNLVFAEASPRDNQDGFEAAAQFRTFLYVNSVALRASLHYQPAMLLLLLQSTARLHITSCTDAVAVGVCDYAEFDGAQGAEVAVDAVISAGPDAGLWHYTFAALHAAYANGGSQVLRERRFIVQTGLRLPTSSWGQWQLAALFFLGNDIGLLRQSTRKQFGLTLRWSPSTQGES